MNHRNHLLATVALVALFAVSAPAASYSVLHSFGSVSFDATNIFGNEENSDGDNPLGGVVVSGNTLYGTAFGAGSNASGTVFSIGADGSDFTVLHTFSLVDSTNANSDGASPYGLALGGDTLYGATGIGGVYGSGAVYSVNTDGGGFTTLYSFTAGSDGANPSAGVVLSGSTIYGTTQFEGNGGGNGTVFSVGTSGGFSTLHHFDGFDDGTQPAGPLTVSGSILYGTASGSGNMGNGQGTIFSITTGGNGFTVLHTFSALDENGNNIDGATPTGVLVISGGTLYGTASIGGANGNGTVFAIDLGSTNFTLLHTFTAVSSESLANSDGVEPLGGLILSGTTLYGTTGGGGSQLSGTVFSIDTGSQKFSTLYDFEDFPYGDNPQDAVTLVGSVLYGTTRLGGQNGTGVVFSLPASGSSSGGSGGTGSSHESGVEITIEPVGAVEAGAQFELDGGSPQASGSIATSSTGGQTISYTGVTGWTAPPAQTVSVKNNVVSKIKATYTFAGEGVYSGLFMSSIASESTSGMLKTLTVTKTASYTGTLQLSGASHSFSGVFNGASLSASNSIPHTDISLVMTLLPASNLITGTVTIGSAASMLTAYLSSNRSSGEYTALLTPDLHAASNAEPAGDGYLLITNHSGAAKITGALPDGETFTQSVGVSSNGNLPVYANLNGGKGLVTGWVNLNESSGAHVTWVYPGVRTSHFTSAFTATNPVLLSTWTTSAAESVLPGLTQLTFLGTNFLVTNLSDGKITGTTLSGSINLKTGQIKVTDKDKVSGYGAVLLNTNAGGGYSVSKSAVQVLELNP